MFEYSGCAGVGDCDYGSDTLFCLLLIMLLCSCQTSGFELTAGLGASMAVCLCWMHVWFLGFYLLFGMLVCVAYDRSSFFPHFGVWKFFSRHDISSVLPNHSESLNCRCMNFFLLVMLTFLF